MDFQEYAEAMSPRETALLDLMPLAMKLHVSAHEVREALFESMEVCFPCGLCALVPYCCARTTCMFLTPAPLL